jgi:hypothetical protein
MNFTYEIKKYNKDSSQILVLYSPTDLDSKYKWVNIESDWSEQQIKNGIVSQFPSYLWQVTENQNIDSLIDTQGSATYVAPVIEEHVQTEEEVAEQVRSMRKGLLFDSDWTQLADAPLSAEEKSSWEVYRQSLRDITNQVGFPLDIVWPAKPGVNT